MDRTATRFDAETLLSTTTGTATTGRRNRRSKETLNVAAPDVDATLRAEYEAFAATIREELDPRDTIESIYVERAIVASWQLKAAVDAERAGILGGLTIGGDSRDVFGGLAEDLRRETDRAERSLHRVLDAIRDLRDSAKGRWGHADHPSTPVILDDESTFVPEPAPALDPDSDDTPLPRWQDRLIFDENVSFDSPVVRGTWITVSQIVTLIVDGYTWADILRAHPELTEDDIRMCLQYATEEENDG